MLPADCILFADFHAFAAGYTFHISDLFNVHLTFSDASSAFSAFMLIHTHAYNRNLVEKRIYCSQRANKPAETSIDEYNSN